MITKAKTLYIRTYKWLWVLFPLNYSVEKQISHQSKSIRGQTDTRAHSLTNPLALKQQHKPLRSFQFVFRLKFYCTKRTSGRKRFHKIDRKQSGKSFHYSKIISFHCELAMSFGVGLWSCLTAVKVATIHRIYLFPLQYISSWRHTRWPSIERTFSLPLSFSSCFSFSSCWMEIRFRSKCSSFSSLGVCTLWIAYKLCI